MRAVRYHPEARAEFLCDVEYYAAISPGLAEFYDKAVHTAEQQAARDPEAWPKFGKRTRRVIDRTFKFSLVLSAKREGNLCRCGRSREAEAGLLEKAAP